MGRVAPEPIAPNPLSLGGSCKVVSLELPPSTDRPTCTVVKCAAQGAECQPEDTPTQRENLGSQYKFHMQHRLSLLTL